MNQKNEQGFTLIEVLIALVILAVALTAVMYVMRNSIQRTDRVKTKLAAHWIAMNIISEIQLGILIPPRNRASVEGAVHMLNQTWRWQARISENSNLQYKRITITVFQKSRFITKRDGFIWWPKK